MSEPATPRVPPQAEQPSGADEVPLQLERETLENYPLAEVAGRAALRAVISHERNLSDLKQRIEVLQTKLDASEEEGRELNASLRDAGDTVRKLTGRVAQLEQAERAAKLLTRDGTVALALGGIAVSMGGLFSIEELRYVVAALGVGVIVMAFWICKIMQRNIWPVPKVTDD